MSPNTPTIISITFFFLCPSGWQKFPSVGEVWIFSGMAQCHVIKTFFEIRLPTFVIAVVVVASEQSFVAA